MPVSKRMVVARELIPIGLTKTLVVVDTPHGRNVSRIKHAEGDRVGLEVLGQLPPGPLPAIGRVGIADPHLGADWGETMVFYGKWFDEIGETDAGYHLRKGISSLSRDRLLEQIRRDEQYALVADFESAFRTIIEVKSRIPLVHIEDTYLALTSFPVVLPAVGDESLRERMAVVQKIMFKASERRAPGPPDNGIEVNEIDG
ncbi:MAG: hypothetical protein ACU85V_02310 [Gammaproteobacteria bacterium]